MDFNTLITRWDKNILVESKRKEVFAEINKTLKEKKLGNADFRQLMKSCLNWIDGVSQAERAEIRVIIKFIFEKPDINEKYNCLVYIYNYIITKDNNPKISLELLPIIETKDALDSNMIKIYTLLSFYYISVAHLAKEVDSSFLPTITSYIKKIMSYNQTHNTKEFFVQLENFYGGKYVILSRMRRVFSAQQVVDFAKNVLEEPFKNLTQISDGENFLIFLKLLASLNYETVEYQQLGKYLVESIRDTFETETLKKCIEILLEFFNYLVTMNATDAEVPVKRMFKVLKKINDTKSLAENPEIQETVLFVSKKLSQIKKFNDFDVTAVFGLTYVNFCNNLMKIIRKYPDKEQVACDKCSSVRRHVTNDILNSVMSLYNQVISKKDINSFLATFIWENIKYRFTILDELKCVNKDLYLNDCAIKLYHSLYEFSNCLDMAGVCIEVIKESIRLLTKYIMQLKDTNLQMRKLVIVSDKIFESLPNDKFLQDKINFKGSQIFYYLSIGEMKQARQYICLMKQFLKANGVEKTVVDLLADPTFENFNFEGIKVEDSDLIFAEMFTVFRYTNNYAENLKLFEKLLKATKDAKILGSSLTFFDNATFEKLDEKELAKIRMHLLKTPINETNNVEIKAALALIYFNQSNKAYNSTKSKLKEFSYQEVEKVADECTIKDELKIVQNLTESLKCFEKLVHYLEVPGASDRLHSNQKFIKMLETIATQFYYRNLIDKSVEAVKLMMKWAEMQNHEMNLVISGSMILLLNSALLTDAIIESLEEYVKRFETLDNNKQCHVLYYLLNLASHYSKLKNIEKLKETIETFRKNLEIFEEKEEAKDHLNPIYCKYYYCMGMIDFKNPTNEGNPKIYFENCLLQAVKPYSIPTDFNYQVLIILYEIVSKTFNYYKDRSRVLDGIEPLLRVLQKLAQRNGFIMQAINILVMMAELKLRTEKVDEALTHLKHLDIFLELNGESLEQAVSPTVEKMQPFTKLVELGAIGGLKIESVRKIGLQEHFVGVEVLEDSDQSFFNTKEIVDLLKRYIHPENCKCNNCKYFILQFRFFQIGCLYTNLMYLKGKFDVCESFGEMVVANLGSMLKEFERKEASMSFYYREEIVSFLIHWLLKIFDAILKLNNLDDCERYLEYAKNISSANLSAHDPLLQVLKVKEETLNSLQSKDYENAESKKTGADVLDFQEFERRRAAKKKSKERKILDDYKKKKLESSLIPQQTSSVTFKVPKIVIEAKAEPQPTDTVKVKKIECTPRTSAQKNYAPSFLKMLEVPTKAKKNSKRSPEKLGTLASTEDHPASSSQEQTKKLEIVNETSEAAGKPKIFKNLPTIDGKIQDNSEATIKHPPSYYKNLPSKRKNVPGKPAETAKIVTVEKEAEEASKVPDKKTEKEEKPVTSASVEYNPTSLPQKELEKPAMVTYPLSFFKSLSSKKKKGSETAANSNTNKFKTTNEQLEVIVEETPKTPFTVKAGASALAKTPKIDGKVLKKGEEKPESSPLKTPVNVKSVPIQNSKKSEENAGNSALLKASQSAEKASKNQEDSKPAKLASVKLPKSVEKASKHQNDRPGNSTSLKDPKITGKAPSKLEKKPESLSSIKDSNKREENPVKTPKNAGKVSTKQKEDQGTSALVKAPDSAPPKESKKREENPGTLKSVKIPKKLEAKSGRSAPVQVPKSTEKVSIKCKEEEPKTLDAPEIAENGPIKRGRKPGTLATKQVLESVESVLTEESKKLEKKPGTSGLVIVPEKTEETAEKVPKIHKDKPGTSASLKVPKSAKVEADKPGTSSVRATRTASSKERKEAASSKEATKKESREKQVSQASESTSKPKNATKSTEPAKTTRVTRKKIVNHKEE